MKHFWLIRHAKTEDSAGPGTSDFDRDLNKRGRRDGDTLQAWFRQQASEHPEYRPDWLITSSAVRAVATSVFVAQGFDLSMDQQTSDESLYLAGPEVLLDALRSTPGDANCVALVAHNPGMTWLVNMLSVADEGIDNLPTFGCALFQADFAHGAHGADWTDLTRATRVLLTTPKMLGAQTDFIDR